MRPRHHRPDAGTALVERARLQWRRADGGDPADARRGVPRRPRPARCDDLAAPRARRTTTGGSAARRCTSRPPRAPLLAGAPPGRPSPAPALPDLAVVVYEPRRPSTGRHPRAGAGRRGGSATGRRAGPRRSTPPPSTRSAQAIGRGDVYQVNVVGHAAAPYTGDPLPALARLGALPGARYGGVLTGAGWAIGCASPETLIEVTDGRLDHPTDQGHPPGHRRRPRASCSATREGTRRTRDDRRPGTQRPGPRRPHRHRPRRRALRGTPLVRPVAGRVDGLAPPLADGLGLADLLRAVCPGGSVTGAPKLAALDQIAALEPVGRGAEHGRARLGRPRPHRPGPDHPHRRRRRRAGCTCGPAAASPGTATRTPRSPRRPPRAAPIRATLAGR